MKSRDSLIALFITINFFFFFFVHGTLDLENRMTAVHSLAKKSELNLTNSNPNVEAYFGLPIYDYSLGLGTNLPITSGLSRISTLTFFIDVPDDILTLTFLSLLLFITLCCLIKALSVIHNLELLTLSIVLVGFLYPLIIYTIINDWPDVAISYLSLILIQTSLFLIRLKIPETKSSVLALYMFSLGACLAFFGQTGYLPIILLTGLAQLIAFRKVYSAYFKVIIPDHMWLAIGTAILLIFSSLNLFHILNSDGQKKGQVRDSQQLDLNLNLFESSRQPTLLAILFLFFLLYVSRKTFKKEWKGELFLAIGIIIVFWNSSKLGFFAPSSEWLIRDYLWIQLLLLLATTQKKINKIKNKENIINYAGLTLVLLIVSSPIMSIITAPNESRYVSWVNQPDFNKSEFHELLSKQLLVAGDRVLTAPSELIRNRGGGISGLISYTDLTSQGITSISSWSKMRDSSVLVFNEKMFENRAFTEDCNRFILQFTSPTVVITEKSLSLCNESLEALDYLKTWSNDKFNIFRGIPNSLYEIKGKEFSPDFFTENMANSCGLLQHECDSFLKQELMSYLKVEQGGPFCESSTETKGWCLEFDMKTYERIVILPILFENTLYSKNNLEVRNAGGLASVKIPENFEGKVILRYRPSLLDSQYYASSLVLSLLVVFLSTRLLFFPKVLT